MVSPRLRQPWADGLMGGIWIQAWRSKWRIFDFIHHRQVRFFLGKNVDLLVHENPEVGLRESAEDVLDIQFLASHEGLVAGYLQEVGTGPVVGEDHAVVQIS